ncbi:MAG: hypothetical protein U9Q96_02035 [Patescibacteria group bacterium]|nr:hypothetical protein [Patescibacteria group bacterium]
MSNRSKVKVEQYCCKISLKIPIHGLINQGLFWRGWVYVIKYKRNQFVALGLFQDHGTSGNCHDISRVIRSRLLRDMDAVLRVVTPLDREYNFAFELSPSASFSGHFLPMFINAMRKIEYPNCEDGWEIREIRFDGRDNNRKTVSEQLMSSQSGID